MGAGRKKGSGTRRTRKTTALAEQQAGEGILPLAVLLFDMRRKFAAEDYNGAAERARDAAPYLHPRQASLAVNANVGVQLEIVEEIVTAPLETNGRISDNNGQAAGS